MCLFVLCSFHFCEQVTFLPPQNELVLSGEKRSGCGAKHERLGPVIGSVSWKKKVRESVFVSRRLLPSFFFLIFSQCRHVMCALRRTAGFSTLLLCVCCFSYLARTGTAPTSQSTLMLPSRRLFCAPRGRDLTRICARYPRVRQSTHCLIKAFHHFFWKVHWGFFFKPSHFFLWRK